MGYTLFQNLRDGVMSVRGTELIRWVPSDLIAVESYFRRMRILLKTAYCKRRSREDIYDSLMRILTALLNDHTRRQPLRADDIEFCQKRNNHFIHFGVREAQKH